MNPFIRFTVFTCVGLYVYFVWIPTVGPQSLSLIHPKSLIKPKIKRINPKAASACMHKKVDMDIKDMDIKDMDIKADMCNDTRPNQDINRNKTHTHTYSTVVLPEPPMNVIYQAGYQLWM